MTIKRKMVLPLALAVGALGLMAVSQVASGSHVRPKGASPLRASLVPAYKQCIPPGNRQHGAPLVFASCTPPVQESNFLTIGSPDANGAGANSNAYILLRVKATSPEDVLIDSVGTDVRCKPAAPGAFCTNANAADGPDYAGGIQGNATIRISDHYNGPSLNEAATVQDIPFPVGGSCAATATATNIGGTCSVHTSANAVVSGSVKDTQRGVVEIQQLQVKDGGSSGAAGAPDATLFEVQGIFIP
jgi:hypothetical protein